MWSIGDLELRTFFIPSVDKITGKKTTIPVSIRRLPLIHKNKDGTETRWHVIYNRGKFSIHYPDSIRDIDPWGFCRPNGKKIVKNADTGLDGKTLLIKLLDKFDRDFVYNVISAIGGKSVAV